jgi:hypothetical protein
MTNKQQIAYLSKALKNSLKAIAILEEYRSKINDKYEPWETADYFNVLDDMMGTAKSSSEEIAEHLRKVVAGEVIE